MYNTVKSFILMAALTALLMVAGQALGGSRGMSFALFMAFAMNFFAYWYSDKMALAMSRAKPLNESQAPELFRLIRELSLKAGLPMPRVYLISSPTPNAFATGRNPQHAAIAVTAGLLKMLGTEELEGVLAHELGHIKNRDILIGSIAAVMAGAISYLATMAQWAMLFGGFGGRDEDGEGAGGAIGAIIMMILAPLAAALIQMAISRSREFQADATGAVICGGPRGLANALRHLEAYNKKLPMDVNPATAQMYIVNPLSASGVANLFSTHPPIEERIRRLLHQS
jgi:heat shock protein HtpX